MLTVIIATTGRPESLKNTLQSLSECEVPICPLSLFVIVNGNDNVSYKIAESFTSLLPIRCFFLKDHGKNKSINSILNLITDGLLLFTDDDIRFDKNWLTTWEHCFNSQAVGRIYCGSIDLDADDIAKQKIDSLDLEEGFLFSKTDIKKQGPISAELCWGCNLAIPAEVFTQGHRFNEKIGPNGKWNYRMGSEVELCVRLERIGYQCFYEPKAKVFHRVRPEQLTAVAISNRYFRAGRSAFLFRQFDQKANNCPWDVIKGIFFLKIKIILRQVGLAAKEKQCRKNDFSFLMGQIYEYFYSVLRLPEK